MLLQRLCRGERAALFWIEGVAGPEEEQRNRRLSARRGPNYCDVPVDESVPAKCGRKKLPELATWQQPGRFEFFWGACWEELRQDRDAFDLHFRQKNDELRKRGLYL